MFAMLDRLLRQCYFSSNKNVANKYVWLNRRHNDKQVKTGAW